MKFGLFASTFLMAAGIALPPFAHAASSAAVPVVAQGLSGVVTSSKGAEAGVWVIAETRDLPTRFIQIVVTDDQGRYVLPQLPKANYNVWVRGYGLVDSKPVKATPGQKVNLTAVIAPDAKAAAAYYPANYWLAMLEVPGAGEFPGTGPKGNGISPRMKNQQDWHVQLKENCQMCHQMGNTYTRTALDPTPEGWAQRISQGREFGDQTMGNTGLAYGKIMQNNMTLFGRDRGLKMYADWSKRIADGELPKEAPPRPQGLERNVVLTLWDWGHNRFIHDEISSDRRNPHVNANGPVYGVSPTTGRIETLDPVNHVAKSIPLPGDGKDYDINVFAHNPMVDQKGRVWVTDSTRSRQVISAEIKGNKIEAPLGNRDNYCTDPSVSKYAKYFPRPGRNSSQIGVYDPATSKVSLWPACYGAHHLGFGYDANNTLYFSGDTNVVGWLDTKVYDETGDTQKSQGWCPMVLNTNEKTTNKVPGLSEVVVTPDHKQWNEPRNVAAASDEGGGGGEVQVDPTKDTRISGFLYGMDTHPTDGSVWFAKTSPSMPTGIVRLQRGTNPPETCQTEYYEPPKNADGTYRAFDGRAVAFDTPGLAWVTFGSGQFASFDRKKCKVTSGPTATGQHCPEGWTFYDLPGPRIAGTNVQADWNYQNWTDRFDTFGLGKDVPLANGTNSDSIIALDPKTKKVLTFRVPYPMGFYSRGMDGRIDDPKAGWKGKGIWANFGTGPVWHQEGGLDGEGPQLVKFQMRPDPLAF